MGVYSEMVPYTTAAKRLQELKPDAVILSGGPRSVLEEGAPSIEFADIQGLPILGICYGQQLMAHRLGGIVAKATSKEYGHRILETTSGSLVGDLPDNQVWMSHGDQVELVPTGFEVTATTESCPVAAFENEATKQYGVQFHPEVTHTPEGKTVLRRFLFEKVGLRGDWTSDSFIEEEVARIRGIVGDGKVLCAVSGGAGGRQPVRVRACGLRLDIAKDGAL